MISECHCDSLGILSTQPGLLEASFLFPFLLLFSSFVLFPFTCLVGYFLLIILEFSYLSLLDVHAYPTPNEDIVKFWCAGEVPIFEKFLKICDFVFGNVCTFSD